MLTELRHSEGSLKNTLIAAQRLADDIKVNAEEDAGRIISDAEGRSELLLEKTQARLEDIQREIDGLEAQTPRRRDVHRVHHSDAAQHARVRPRAGSA